MQMGLNTVQDKFETKTLAFHVRSPNNFPYYMVKDKTGELRLALGNFDKGSDININASMVANPPALKDGEEALPVLLTIRNPQSPDALRFVEEQALKVIKAKDGDDKQLNAHEINEIRCSAVITDMANVYLVNKNGKMAELKYSEANAVRLIREVASLKEQLIPIINSAGNFMGLESLIG